MQACPYLAEKVVLRKRCSGERTRRIDESPGPGRSTRFGCVQGWCVLYVCVRVCACTIAMPFFSSLFFFPFLESRRPQRFIHIFRRFELPSKRGFIFIFARFILFEKSGEKNGKKNRKKGEFRTLWGEIDRWMDRFL